MIIINKKYNDNGTVEPERSLTDDESSVAIARWGNDTEYWYFTNEDLNSTEWQSYQEYINPSIIIELIAEATRLRIVLFKAGLLETVNNAVTSAGGEIVIWWNYSAVFHCNDPRVKAMASQLGINDDQLNALFTAANEIN